MSRLFGLHPAMSVAAEQLQKSWPPHAHTEPLPGPQYRPGRVDGEHVGITDSDPITLYVLGDSGGVKDPNPQRNVAASMVEHSAGVAFTYHLGDEVYFNGDANEYAPQFYEPYEELEMPIVGIPGNHDGTPDPTNPYSGLQTFLQNFCTAEPEAPPSDTELEFHRHTQTQPSCDWTLCLAAVTIIGVWTNAPSGGHLFPEQQDWLAQELKEAPLDRPVIVAMHHPPYSIDAHHGGSKRMGDALDHAGSIAGRHPELVLTGHVHDYQRFTRADPKSTYIVLGNGGYHNLHKLAPDAIAGDKLGDVVFEAGDDKHWGYLTLNVGGGSIHGSYNAVDKSGNVSHGVDSFSI